MYFRNHFVDCFDEEQGRCEEKSDGSRYRFCTPVFFGSFASCAPLPASKTKCFRPYDVSSFS